MTTGAFVRRDSVFRGWPEGPPERYHLYVALSCPWSHRTLIVRQLAGLEDRLGISYLHPYRDERGWRVLADDVNGFEYLAEAYEATRPGYDDRVSCPVLWDKDSGVIVSNESADIVRMLDAWGEAGLYPESLKAEIDEVNDWVYSDFQNGVYRAGDQLTLADWRLFPTLVRFDTVYYLHFRCNGRRIVDCPNLWGYTRELYQQPGIADTVAMAEIREHYYTTHESLNPKRIIPRGPLDLDFTVPHGRG